MSIFRKYPALFLGLGLTLLFILLGLFRVGFIEKLELKFYDLRMELRAQTKAPSDIVLVNIDDESIGRLGRWPWSRSIIADGLRKISSGGPKAIGLNLMLSEPEAGNRAVRELTELEELFSKMSFSAEGEQGRLFKKAMAEAKARLDGDKKLSDAIRDSATVVLPVFLKGEAVTGNTEGESNELLLAQSVGGVRALAGSGCPGASEIVTPLPAFLKASKGSGHINLALDIDGKARGEYLFYQYRGLFIPSYSLRLAAAFLNLSNDAIRADKGRVLHLGSLDIPTGPGSKLLISFKGTPGSFKSYSFFDCLSEKIPPAVFKDKLVLVTTTAPGIMNPVSTPVSSGMSAGELSANAVWAILNGRFLERPPWGFGAELFLILAAGIFITFAMPHMKAPAAGIVCIALPTLLLGGATYLFVSKGLWIEVTCPVLELVFGCLGLMGINYFVAEAGKEKVEGESAETNRMLGLSFQGQGMLDMAFDKFRLVPVDKGMLEILYNLALDYERKRQFDKALAVYGYIEEHDNQFKDIENRKKKLIQASETIVVGGGSASEAMLAGTATETRPTLGRYELIKQLGKGAMGVVYLGQDPRINRITAIKTFRFSEDLEPEDVKKLKEKFFIEAESAGTLSHPNIVTIYDAGEERDLAYIAMEYLEGENLQGFTKEERLLPMRKVIDYVADIADALDYAHQKGIVHRDIKPANIMLLKTGIVKITDFGIARIAASSQTQTGVVKGTPYYMSPEQISGKRVDGKSDIFSLGTMLYQLLTGRLPFAGENLAALMHQIMTASPPDPREYNPKLPKPLVDIINHAMEKDLGKRYGRSSQMAGHLRILGGKIDEMLARKKSQQA